MVNRGTTGVNSLPKTVTRQRRGCDLNPGPTAPESSTLTTRLPSCSVCAKRVIGRIQRRNPLSSSLQCCDKHVCLITILGCAISAAVVIVSLEHFFVVCVCLSAIISSHCAADLRQIFYACYLGVPSVLRRCWLGGRKGIRPVKNRVVGCWRGYQSGARCRLAYGPADATATHCLLLQ